MTLLSASNATTETSLYIDEINGDFPSPSPVILLPGILGSWTINTLNFFEPINNPNPIPQSKLSLIEESQAWPLRQLDDFGKLPHTWEDLKVKLPQLGFQVYKCPYDWRNTTAYIAEHYLIPCIDKAKQETGASKVNIVAHSMGGLVARAYIQSNAYRDDIAKLAMIGTPNHGSADAYYPWEGGDMTQGLFGLWGDVMEKVMGGRLVKIGTQLARIALVNYVHSFFPSIQELLPTFPYLKNENTGSLRAVGDMVWQNDFLSGLNSSTRISLLANQLTSRVFAGEGYETEEIIEVMYPNPDNPGSFSFLPYPDGEPTSTEVTSFLGDMTVLSQNSAKITEVAVPLTTKTKQIGNPENFLAHTNLPNAFFHEVNSFLGGTATTTPSYSPSLAKEMLAVSLASPADLLIIGPQGKKLGFDSAARAERYEIPQGIYSGVGEIELAAIVDPEPGNYTVYITGNGTGEFHTGVSYAKEGCEGALEQENFGQTATGTVTIFTLEVQGGCGEDAATYTLDATVGIDPNTLNLTSKGNYITAYIELPNPYEVEDINVLTILLNNQITALRIPTAIGDYDGDGVRDLMVKFNRSDVQRILTPGRNELTASGNLSDGTKFAGKDVFNVINNLPPKKLFTFFDFLRELLSKFSFASAMSSFK